MDIQTIPNNQWKWENDMFVLDSDQYPYYALENMSCTAEPHQVTYTYTTNSGNPSSTDVQMVYTGPAYENSQPDLSDYSKHVEELMHGKYVDEVKKVYETSQSDEDFAKEIQKIVGTSKKPEEKKQNRKRKDRFEVLDLS